MNYTFSDIKGLIDFNKNKEQSGYTMPMTPNLNKVVGNIDQEQITTISGLPGSGVSSFIDQNYVMSVLLQWYMIDPDERPPLKILYFSMKTSELKKLQLLLCNYIKLVSGLQIDLATLNNQAGKLFNINERVGMEDAINDASTFFDEIHSEGILDIYGGQRKPTDIYNIVSDFMLTKGYLSAEGSYVFDDDNRNLITLVVVDDVTYLLPDSDGYGIVQGNDLDEKFKRYLKELKNSYKITAVLAVPSNVGYVRSVKDTEPHFRHLGTYGSITDKGICIYNAINEKNVKFYDGDESLYVTLKGNNLFRTWHVVRNTDGIESLYDRLLFLPGTSFMIEHSKKIEITSIDEVLDVIRQETCFHDLN